MSSLLYTFDYYVSVVPSWTWHYSYPVAPWPSDMIAYLKSYTKDLSPPRDNSKPSSPLAQLSYVIPKDHWGRLFPKNVRGKMIRFLKKDDWQKYYPKVDNVMLWGLDEHKYIYSDCILQDMSKKDFGRLCNYMTKIEK